MNVTKITQTVNKFIKEMAFNRAYLSLVAVLLFLACAVLNEAVVQFKFNTPELTISEKRDLSNQLSIMKIGQNEMNITFQVRVIPGTAQENTDYIPNSRDPYVFTRNTRLLPIKTQLVQNQASESIETFMICLPEAQVLQSMGAEAVDPRCVNVTIIDDDSVVIGFKKSFETVMEGGTKMVCAEVKPEGLRLDPFDRVPVPIQTNSESEVALSTNLLVFEMSNERCATVTVADSDTTSMGNRLYQLILEEPRTGSSTVSVLLYPSTIPIIVIDNNSSDVNFSINSTQQVFIVRKGDIIDSISIQKCGNTLLSYTVSLMVIALTDSANLEDVIIMNSRSLIFNPSTTELGVGAIEIEDDSQSEGRKVFNISINTGGIQVVNAPGAVPFVAVLGDPVKIIFYDNDFEVGFTIDTSVITLTEGVNHMICVRILELKPVDIDPEINIPLQISMNLKSNTSNSGNLELIVNEVLLNAVNNSGCFIVAFPDDSECENSARNFTIQLAWIRPDNPEYSISIERENVTIIVDDSQDCPSSSSMLAKIASIVTLLLGLVIISLIV